MKTLLTLLLLCLGGAARADDWTTEQKAMGATLAAAIAVDYGQTRSIAHRPECWEYNPIMGRHPTETRINVYFVAAPLLAYALLDNVSSGHRTVALRVLAGVELAVVGRNAYLGYGMRF